MAQITWRNVDAPNLSGVNDSIRTFSGLLGNATSGLSDAIGNFQGAAKSEAGNQVLANALQYQDPTEYRNALASGALFNGVDPSMVSSAVLGRLDDRAGSLLDRANTQQNIDTNQYDLTRKQDLNQRSDTAAPALQALGLAYQSGDPSQIAAAQTKYGGELSKLPSGQVIDYLTNLQGQGSTGISQRTNLFNLGRDMRNDADQQAATGVLSQITRGAENPNDARLLAEAYSSQLSPGAQAILQRQLGSAYPGTYGNNVSAGAPGTRTGSAYDTTYKFTGTSTPITQTSIGDVVKQQTGMISSLGASPVGAYQINQATLKEFAPKALGSDWEQQPLNPENQEKIAEAIFNARKGGNLKDTWAALPNSGVGAYKDKTWEDVRGDIAQGEVGADRDKLNQDRLGKQAVSNLASTVINSRLMQNNTVGITPDYLRALGDTATPGQAADALLANDFKGADPNWVQNRIDDVTNRAGVSPAIAAAAIQRSKIGVPENIISRGIDALNPFITNEAGNKSRIDDKKLTEIIEGLKRGEPIEASVRNISTAQASQMIQQAQDAYDNALAQYQNTQNKINSGQTALNALLPSRLNSLQQAQALLTQAQNQVQQDPNNLSYKGFTTKESELQKQEAARVQRAREDADKQRAIQRLETANPIPGYKNSPYFSGR